jgi:hypothetical protein
MYKFLKKPYTLAGFELRIFCSEGGCADHYTMPPGLRKISYKFVKNVSYRFFEYL